VEAEALTYFKYAAGGAVALGGKTRPAKWSLSEIAPKLVRATPTLLEDRVNAIQRFAT
jgi:hypothetical protein